MRIEDIKVGDKVKWADYYIDGNGEIKKESFEGKIENILSDELDLPIQVRREGRPELESIVYLSAAELTLLD